MKRWIADIICGLLILLFVYAAFTKLTEFGKFTHALSEAPVIGNFAAFLVSAVIIAVLIIVLLLMIPGTPKTGLFYSTGLLIVFKVYLVFMVLTDPHLPCSSGGVIRQLSWKQHIVFNTFFIGLGITGIYYQRKEDCDNQRSGIIQHT